MSNTLTGSSTRWYTMKSVVSGEYAAFSTDMPLENRAFFWTEAAAKAYCGWQNGFANMRKPEPEPEAVEDEASGWRYNAILDRITEADGHVVAVPSGKYSWGHSDFRMMAAAPELKAALEAILPYAASAPRPLLDKAVKALEKAEGKG